MLRTRFTALALRYGCHDRAWEMPSEDRPIVIAGPNASGKTTLVEGLLRTLFGYDRRRGSEAERLEARRPWDGDEMRGEVTVTRGDEAYRIRRDFSSDRVHVHSPAEGVTHFEGDGNPGARNQEAIRYRQILADVVGLADLDAYSGTVFVRQGALPETELGEHLLRAAAGGHARVDAARREVAEAHRAVTRRPIRAGAKGAVNPRELEKLNDEIAAIEGRLASARQAGERRGPLAIERERTAERRDALDEEVRSLEEAQSALARGSALESEGRHLREWSRMLDRLESELLRDASRLADARAEEERAGRGGVLPGDFAERVARAELRWRDLEALRSRITLWPAVLAIALILAAVGAFLAGAPIPAAAAGAIGVLGLSVWLAFRIDAGRRARTLRTEVAETLHGVPEASRLTYESRQEYLSRFAAQRAAAHRVEESRLRLADTLREARAALRDAAMAGLRRNGRDRADADEADDAPVASHEERLAARLREVADQARERLARARVEMERIGDASLRLPDGVPPTPASVGDALRQRREERARVQEELQTIGQELLERGTPLESTAALEAALATLIPRRDALLRKAEVLEAAHALIADAYDAFREKDQERLVRNASAHSLSLSAGKVGPIVAPGLLEDAAVRIGDRLVPMATPPLSFGEYHALMLGIRMGAADFLAGVGILPPLIIDEPFAHLDTERSAAVWELIVRAAAVRQVIVTTQDALLLDHLGIDADIRLAAPPAAVAAGRASEPDAGPDPEAGLLGALHGIDQESAADLEG